MFCGFAVVDERASVVAQLWDAHQDSGHRFLANATLELAVEENAALLCVVGGTRIRERRCSCNPGATSRAPSPNGPVGKQT